MSTAQISGSPRSEVVSPVAGLAVEQLPKHIAIIMDGNGRWAERRGLPRVAGHRQGIQSVRSVVEQAGQLGLSFLTLYCLSSENWKRPEHELQFLFELLRHFMRQERAKLIENNVRVRTIGSRQGLASDILKSIDETIEATAGNTGLTLCLAINYGGRAEIVEAARRFALDVQAGRFAPEDLDEAQFGRYLHTGDMPDPDLLIRTAGEMRLSNYLLWQVSYAEFWVTSELWPDFRGDDLIQAIRDYAQRRRKFGGLLKNGSKARTESSA